MNVFNIDKVGSILRWLLSSDETTYFIRIYMYLSLPPTLPRFLLKWLKNVHQVTTYFGLYLRQKYLFLHPLSKEAIFVAVIWNQNNVFCFSLLKYTANRIYSWTNISCDQYLVPIKSGFYKLKFFYQDKN